MNAKTIRTAAPADPKPFKKKTVLTPKPVNADIRNMPAAAYKRYLKEVAADFKKYGFSVTCSFYEHAERCSKAEATFQIFAGNADTGLRIATVALTQLLRDGVLVKTKNDTHEVFMHKAFVSKTAKKPAPRKAKAVKPEQVTPRHEYDNSQLSRLPIPTKSDYERVTLRGIPGTLRVTDREWARLTAHRKNRRVIGKAIQVSAPRTMTVKQLLAAAGLKSANNLGLSTKVKVSGTGQRWATVAETEAWVAGELELRRTLVLSLLANAERRVEDAEEGLVELTETIEKQKKEIVEVKARKAELDKQFGFLKLI